MRKNCPKNIEKHKNRQKYIEKEEKKEKRAIRIY